MALTTEVERLRDEAARQVRRADRRAHLWAVTDIALGLPAALFAAVAGAAGLATADARVPAALLALFSAGFSAATTFLRSDARRIANKRSRQAWAAVEGDALLTLARAPYVEPDALQQELRSLFDARRAAMNAYESDPSVGLPSR